MLDAARRLMSCAAPTVSGARRTGRGLARPSASGCSTQAALSIPPELLIAAGRASRLPSVHGRVAGSAHRVVKVHVVACSGVPATLLMAADRETT
jgi:hypothetical protein